MCDSRKYPYPKTKRISLRAPPPPPPWIFHICKELMPPPPPTPPEFPQYKTKTPQSLWKVYFHQKKISG